MQCKKKLKMDSKCRIASLKYFDKLIQYSGFSRWRWIHGIHWDIQWPRPVHKYRVYRYLTASLESPPHNTAVRIRRSHRRHRRRRRHASQLNKYSLTSRPRRSYKLAPSAREPRVDSNRVDREVLIPVKLTSLSLSLSLFLSLYSYLSLYIPANDDFGLLSQSSLDLSRYLLSLSPRISFFRISPSLAFSHLIFAIFLYLSFTVHTLVHPLSAFPVFAINPRRLSLFFQVFDALRLSYVIFFDHRWI